MFQGMRRALQDVLPKVTRAVNEPFRSDNQCSPRSDITLRRDSMCISVISSQLRKEFGDDSLDPRFIFEHPTIEGMAASLCGRCECPYCSAGKEEQATNGAAPSDTPGRTSEVLAVGQRKVVPFTQLVGMDAPPPSKSLAGGLYRHIGGERYARATDGLECVLLPGGPAWIGADTIVRAGLRPLPCEQPCHEVVLRSFLIDVEPISVGAYARFLNIVKADEEALLDWFLLPECDERRSFVPLHVNKDGVWEAKPGVSARWPMYLVSWYGANAYSLWAAGMSWKTYRSATPSNLPTEAQWEYAARGASPKCFPWGDGDATPELLQVSWDGLPVPPDPTVEDLGLVDVNVELGVSRFGLRHMAGNVWQWCRDTYDPTFYRKPKATEPDAWNDSPEGMKVERGGSWVGPACLARSSYRRGRDALAKGRCLGFRCVADATVVLPEGVAASSTAASSDEERLE